MPGSETRPPRFYRVSQKDENIFPSSTFSSLSLDTIDVKLDTLEVSWSVQLDYYYTDYDWGVIFRQIGDQQEDMQFFKTRYNLKNHLEANSDWSPKSENLTAVIGGLQSYQFYEVCLAVVEHVTVYYIHRDLCQEVQTQSAETDDDRNIQEDSMISTKNVSVVPSHNSVTLTWQIDIDDFNMKQAKSAKDDMISVIRQISVRKFGSDNATQLFVLEDFNKTALLMTPGGGKKATESSRYL